MTTREVLVARKPKQWKGDWVVMGPAPYFATCERCGKHIAQPELPMPLDAFAAFCAYITKLHASCAIAAQPDAEVRE